VRINSIHYSSTVHPVSPENGSVSLVINSSYYEGWAEYLKQTGAKNVSTNNISKSVNATITSNVVNVAFNQIRIQIK